MVQSSAEKLEQTWPAEKERLPQCHKVNSRQGRQSCLSRKEKEQSHQSKSAYHKAESAFKSAYLQKDLESLDFTPSLKPKINKEVGKRRASL